MKSHSDGGRFMIACAILDSDECSYKLKSVAIECLLAYRKELKMNWFKQLPWYGKIGAVIAAIAIIVVLAFMVLVLNAMNVINIF